MTGDAKNNIDEMLPKNMDFEASIKSLESRAKRARRTMLMIGLALLFVVQTLVVFIFYQYKNQDFPVNKTFSGIFFSSVSLRERLEQREANLVQKLISVESDTTLGKEAETKLKETISLLNDLKSADESRSKSSGGLAVSLATIAFSFGAVGFVILLIQIAVQFMRYYARLEGLYSAQAEALRASDGNPVVAFKFIEHFSPSSIDIGKAPTSVYEKALETISMIAKQIDISDTPKRLFWAIS